MPQHGECGQRHVHSRRMKLLNVQALSLPSELVAKVLGPGVFVGPIVTIEPRRRRFHQPITVTLPLPWELQSAATKYNANNLRLLCSITGISSLIFMTWLIILATD